MAVTLKQIADMAGVHKSTVDKVIHNRPGVSDEMRQKIRRLLDEQGYESNPLAKALNYQKKKMAVAVVLPRVDAMDELRAGIESVRRDFASFNLEIQYYEIDYPDAAAQAACLHELRRQGVSGVVVSPMADDAVRAAIDTLAAAHIPVVTLNSDAEDSARLCFVGRDEHQAGCVAARLVSLLLGRAGNIGMLTSSLRAVRQRAHGFAEYLAAQYPGIRVAQTADTHEDRQTAYAQTCDMLRSHPPLDGLFIACGCVPDVCRAVRDCGLQGRLVIVCFERYPAIIQLVRSGEISCTISGDLAGQGRFAMRSLFEHLVYDKMPETRTIYMSNDILLAENI